MTDTTKLIREYVRKHEPQIPWVQWYVDDRVIDCDAEEFWRAINVATGNRALVWDIRDINPQGSKKIRISQVLGNDRLGDVLGDALTSYPDAPVIIIETPTGSIYYMDTSKEKKP
jgi:hypothetical protein